MYADIASILFPKRLDGQGGVPLRVQLREGVLAAIGDGRLTPGAQLPTMRALSVHLTVDLNTVQRAYAELERLGAIETQRGRGSFVAAHPPMRDSAARRTVLETYAASCIAGARAQGLPPDEVAQTMIDILARGE